MSVLVVDDVVNSAKGISRILLEIDPSMNIFEFYESEKVVESKEILSDCQVAFLDIDMPGISGIDLARQLQIIKPSINIVFTTGYQQYMPEAFAMYASAYIEKPITKRAIIDAMDHLRYPVYYKIDEKKVRVQCFGTFEVFVNDSPMHFYRKKSKELFAYLVDRRGAVCDSDMIIGNLWPDDTVTSSLKSLERMVVTDLFRSLKEYDLKHIINRDKVGLSINTAEVECDYYNYLKGSKEPYNQFRGEYMSQYSFAESTRAYLERNYYE